MKLCYGLLLSSRVFVKGFAEIAVLCKLRFIDGSAAAGKGEGRGGEKEQLNRVAGHTLYRERLAWPLTVITLYEESPRLTNFVEAING